MKLSMGIPCSYTHLNLDPNPNPNPPNKALFANLDMHEKVLKMFLEAVERKNELYSSELGLWHWAWTVNRGKLHHPKRSHHILNCATPSVHM